MSEDIYNKLLSLGQLLLSKSLTIAFAESATAGAMSAGFALVPDAGKFLKGGLVCYDAGLKIDLLGVSKDQLEKYTPESSTVTHAITVGLQKLIPADIHVGCTGLTCAGGSETPDKPVGTMFLCAMQGKKVLMEEKICFQGSREEIVSKTIAYFSSRLETCL